jgi:Bacterial SH3 domain
MRTADLSETTLNAYSSAESSVDHLANSCVPPVTEPFPAEDSFLEEQTFGATVRDEHLFQPAPPRDLLQLLTSFAAQRKLIVGTAVVATLTVGALAYVFWFSAGEKTTTQTAETTATVQSSPVAPVRADPRTPAPYPAPLFVPAWPDPPASAPVEASPQVAPAARTGGGSLTRQTVPAHQNQDIAFVQRPGVNIRSTPSSNGSVLGIVPKGKRFTVTKREGDWVQVESDYLKGWIKSQFLGRNDAR